jgi:hypothetical protein
MAHKTRVTRKIVAAAGLIATVGAGAAERAAHEAATALVAAHPTLHHEVEYGDDGYLKVSTRRR